MIYEISNDSGEVINRIVATLKFVENHYPGKYRDITPIEVLPAAPVTIDAKVDALAATVAAIYEKVKGLKP